MLPRRIVIGALAATAVVGVLFGGLAGLVGGSDDDPPQAAATRSTSTSSATTAPAAPAPVTPVAASSSPPSTSASPSASKSPSAKPLPAPGKIYHVTSGDRALDVAGENKGDHTPIIIYPASAGKTNQQWSLQDAGGGYFMLVSRVSNKCLDVRGGKAVQDDCGDPGQHWQAQPRGNGFLLVNRSGNALGPGGKVRGEQGLALVPTANATVWTFNPAG